MPDGDSNSKLFYERALEWLGAREECPPGWLRLLQVAIIPVSIALVGSAVQGALQEDALKVERLKLAVQLVSRECDAKKKPQTDPVRAYGATLLRTSSPSGTLSDDLFKGLSDCTQTLAPTYVGRQHDHWDDVDIKVCQRSKFTDYYFNLDLEPLRRMLAEHRIHVQNAKIPPWNYNVLLETGHRPKPGVITVYADEKERGIDDQERPRLAERVRVAMQGFETGLDMMPVEIVPNPTPKHEDGSTDNYVAVVICPSDAPRAIKAWAN